MHPLTVIFLITRLTFLTTLPIFNMLNVVSLVHQGDEGELHHRTTAHRGGFRHAADGRLPGG